MQAIHAVSEVKQKYFILHVKKVQSFRLKMHQKIVCLLSSAGTPCGSLELSPDPLAGVRGGEGKERGGYEKGDRLTVLSKSLHLWRGQGQCYNAEANSSVLEVESMTKFLPRSQMRPQFWL